jgi:protein ImuB
MSTLLYACIYAAEFPTQALLRLQPELRSEPIAVLEGRAPLESVCSMNEHARRKGADRGMTKLESEAVKGLRVLRRSIECEVTARNALLECAANFSPRIEDVSSGTSCTCVLDIAGTEKLFGPPDLLARRIRSALSAAGYHAAIAVSTNFDAARIKAAYGRGIAVIPMGEEASALASIPIHSLNLSEEHAQTFALWGIRTLGELAVLPEAELVSRLGQEARAWRKLALGVHPHTLQPLEPILQLGEYFEFETPVEQIESLMFIGARMIDCLVRRAAERALSLASLTAQMTLEGGAIHRCKINPALPSIDRKFLLKLLQLEIAAHPPPASVASFSLSADAGQSKKMQLGLFVPQTPEPSRLDVTLARLKAIVGEERVGSPVLEDTHRAGSFRLEKFDLNSKTTPLSTQHPRFTLSRMRPPVPVRVAIRASQPVTFRDCEKRYDVKAAYGPWKTSGNWWSLERWNIEEWDILAEDNSGASVACLLLYDKEKNAWQLEAFYD